MQLKASVWKASKSVVEIADEFELGGHILSRKLIYFLYVFDSLANNFHSTNMPLLDIYHFKWNITSSCIMHGKTASHSSLHCRILQHEYN